MQISGSSAVVTGGASGLGAATVRRLVGLGASVVIADLNREAGMALEQELGRQVRFVETDVADEASMERAVLDLGLLRRGQSVVVVGAIPFRAGVHTNFLKLHRLD